MKTETPALSPRDCIDLLDDMSSATAALNFLDTLLDISLNADGGSLNDIHSGLHFLMKLPLDQISSGIKELRAFVLKVERGEVQPRRQVPDDMVELPVYRPGIEQELRARAAAKESAAKLQGVDLGAVARDTNLKEDTVRRVVERLLADPAPDPQAAASNG